MREKLPFKPTFRTIAILIVLFVLGTPLSACHADFTQQAPQRSFAPEDLLIGQETIPVWNAGDPYLPEGDDLCTTECAAIQFWATQGDYPGALATHLVFRYLTGRIAQRTFDYTFLDEVNHYGTVDEWSYQSSIAESSYFGCGNMAGNVGQVCIWGGRYEEFIIVFRTRMIAGEMTIQDMERVVRDIDTIMEDYLGEPLKLETPTGKPSLIPTATPSPAPPLATGTAPPTHTPIPGT